VKFDESFLKRKTAELRLSIVEMITKAGSGHPGGSLSAVDLLAVLYYCVMNIRPENPKWENRDRFILSKGHAAPAIYSILSDIGVFP